jgi:P-type E1-E2 ATPase
VALVSGVSRAAAAGILVKGGKAIEGLARTRVLVIDKTGTLTHGRARIAAIEPEAAWSESEVLRLAASLDQASSHIMARAIVAEARQRGVALSAPADVTEVPGEGIEGSVDGRRVVVGGDGFVRSRVSAGEAEGAPRRRPGTVTVAVGVDGVLAGTLVLSDSLRPGARELVGALRALAIRRIVLASGDRRDVAEAVAGGLDLDAVHGELSPDLKIDVIRTERSHGPVMMIGDGVNDAPALAAADLGVAMGANGAQASAEAADVVLLVDDLSRIVTAIRIARRSQRIALQSVAVGIGLSVAGMLVAAAGYLMPVEGALIQEAIDVAVILNALRALTGDPEKPRFGPAQARSTQ